MEHNLVEAGLFDEDSLLEILKEREKNGNNFVSFFQLFFTRVSPFVIFSWEVVSLKYK